MEIASEGVKSLGMSSELLKINDSDPKLLLPSCPVIGTPGWRDVFWKFIFFKIISKNVYFICFLDVLVQNWIPFVSYDLLCTADICQDYPNVDGTD